MQSYEESCLPTNTTAEAKLYRLIQSLGVTSLCFIAGVDTAGRSPTLPAYTAWPPRSIPQSRRRGSGNRL